jgi:hypothetical protein
VRQCLCAVLSRSSPPTPPSDPDCDTDSDPDRPRPSASTQSRWFIRPRFPVTLHFSRWLTRSSQQASRTNSRRCATSACGSCLYVLGPLLAVFGLHIARYVLCELAGRPLERPLPVHNHKLYERMWKTCCTESRASCANRSSSVPFPPVLILRQLIVLVFA